MSSDTREKNPASQGDLVIVGDFELSPTELFSIVRGFIDGEDYAKISERLDIDEDDLAELLAHPEVFKKAIEARKTMVKLLVYGPLVDTLMTIASGARGDSRVQVQAIKLLRDLSGEGGDKASEKTTTTTVTNNTMNYIGQLPPGGFDKVVRQVEEAQGDVIFVEAGVVS